MSIICRQPLDVLELIVDEVDWREDLLSLALTCALFHNIIIPSHLAYRRVVISVFFRPFFEQIVPRPDLARRVRELTLVNTLPTFEVPREHAFRRHYPESRLLYASGYDDESKSVWADAGDGLRRSFEYFTKLDGTLSALRRLRRLEFRGSLKRLPFERILAAHHPYLDAIALGSGRQSVHDSEGHLFPGPFSYFWEMSGLRTLDLDITLKAREHWDVFCSVLVRSPGLQTLGVPYFAKLNDQNPASMPHLPHLQRISFGDMGNALLNIGGHPSIVEMSYRHADNREEPKEMPHLPAIKRMLNIRGAHVAVLLQRYREAGEALPHLDGIAFDNIPRTLWHWAELSLIFPASLRSVHIGRLDSADHEGYAMLDALAAAFPNLEEIHLPSVRSRYRIPLPAEERNNHPRGHAPGTVLRYIFPPIHHITRRFVRARSVAGVDAGSTLDDLAIRVRALGESTDTLDAVGIRTFLEASRDLSQLHRENPGLSAVNGWSLDTDLAKEVILSDPTLIDSCMQPNPYLILTRKSVRVRYPGTVLDSQPLPLKLKRPRVIPRTGFRDFGD
ncbi:hypothetical protein PENSPDRAFT_658396 [Peniophora sp. CONT]|nr:hypothetical protein PENSPDRAFT_658396 [Peniophora sp. CONT]